MSLWNRKWPLLAVILSGLSGCHIYRGAETEGWVVDEETRRPIQGATVAMSWPIYGGLAHGSTVGTLFVQEVTTDAQGHFVFPMWGPKALFWNSLRNTAPSLVIVQSDYYIQVTGHDDPEYGRPPPSFTSETRECSCNRMTFALKKFDGNWKSYEENAGLALRNIPLDSLSPGFDCVWTKVPRFTREIITRADQFTQRKMIHAIPTAERFDSQQMCGRATPVSENNNDKYSYLALRPSVGNVGDSRRHL